MLERLYINEDNIIQWLGMKSGITGTFVNDAVVTYTITNSDGTQFLDILNVSVPYVENSDGNYQVVFDKSDSALLVEDAGYISTLTATATDLDGKLEIKSIAVVRGNTSASIDSTWGGLSSNSYVDLFVAEAFISKNIIAESAWSNSSVDDISAALVEATRDIDSRQYIGTRYYSNQLLEWPRSTRGYYGETSNNGEISTDNQQVRMKKDVENATCYQAIHLLRMKGRNKHAENIASGVKSYEKKVGPITEKAVYNTLGTAILSPDALRVLQPWITGRHVVRG